MGAEGLTWGRVTPVEKASRRTRYMREAGAPVLLKGGQRAGDFFCPDLPE